MSDEKRHSHASTQSDSRSVDPEADRHDDHGSHSGSPEGHSGGDHQSHHAHMVADFRRRFWVSLVLSIPVLALAPLIQGLLGLEESLQFPGDGTVQLAFATAIFFYGGWPFLTGLYDELSDREPGMMTLIGVAIAVAYVYSTAVALASSANGRYRRIAPRLPPNRMSLGLQD